MDDSKSTPSSPPHQPPSSSSSSLPPGCRFYPSEEQLLSYYLPIKTHNSSSPATNLNPIKEINLYNFNPFELPEITCFRFGFRGQKRHWYCFTAAFIDDTVREGRETRRAGFGFWKRVGMVRDVTSSAGKVVLGRRKCFTYYLEKCSGAELVKKTDWFMYEYTLIGDFQASFVVCRVFAKSRNRKGMSENSGAEDCIATIRHVGIQHDGSAVSILDEKEKCTDLVNETNDGEEKLLIGDVLPNNLVTSPGLVCSTNMLAQSFSAQDFVILDGDFLELDDLI